MSGKTPGTHERILALDVRPHKFGYAVFEAERLIHFGVTRFDSPDAAMSRVTALVRKFAPATVVLRKIAKRSTRNQPLTRAVLRLISRHARHSSIRVALVGDREVRISVADNRPLTKYQIASLLARAFPELAWRLPQPRKPWQPEPWNMLIFDAVALAVSHLVSHHDGSLIPKLDGP